ncbi:MAG: TetR/AcrR family transcriptional regulator [Sphingobium sp.]
MTDKQDDTGPKERRKRRDTGALTDLVLEAANKEFGTHGYAGATTAAIARRADVTEAQLFRLFGSKDALFRAAIFQPLNRHFAEFFRTVAEKPGSIRHSAHDYIDALQDFMEQNSGMLQSLIVASAYSPDFSKQVREMDGLREYFDTGAQTMAKRRGGDLGFDPALMVRVSFAAVLANVMFKDWLFPADVPPSDVRRAIAHFVTDGIAIADE